MSLTKDAIIALPNAHLRQRSKKIGIVDEKIRRLVRDMESATMDWEKSRQHEVGVALAAIQIDAPMRIVIIRSNFDDKKNQTFNVFINPEITKYEGNIEEDFEGCLSVADLYGRVPRYTKVRVKALDINGQNIKLTAEGFLARVFQHEVDHTNGIVFIDHIKDNPDAFFKILEDGQLEQVDYEENIKNSEVLWA